MKYGVTCAKGAHWIQRKCANNAHFTDGISQYLTFMNEGRVAKGIREARTRQLLESLNPEVTRAKDQPLGGWERGGGACQLIPRGASTAAPPRYGVFRVQSKNPPFHAPPRHPSFPLALHFGTLIWRYRKGWDSSRGWKRRAVFCWSGESRTASTNSSTLSPSVWASEPVAAFISHGRV